jgi:hypothetical protein
MRLAAACLALLLCTPAAAQETRFTPPPGTCLLPQTFFLPLVSALQAFGLLPEGAAADCAEVEALGRGERPQGLEAPVAILARPGLAATGADPDRATGVIARIRAQTPVEARALLGPDARRPEIAAALAEGDASRVLDALGARQGALYLPIAAPEDEARFLLDDPAAQERILFAAFPRHGGIAWGVVLDAAHPAPLAPAQGLLDALAAAHRIRRDPIPAAGQEEGRRRRQGPPAATSP